MKILTNHSSLKFDRGRNFEQAPNIQPPGIAGRQISTSHSDVASCQFMTLPVLSLKTRLGH